MKRVSSTRITEFLELQPRRGLLFVLRRGVVPVLALVALQGNDISHVRSTQSSNHVLRQDVSHRAGTDRPAAFPNRKP